MYFLLLHRVLFTWTQCGWHGLQEHQSMRGIVLFAHMSNLQWVPHRQIFSICQSLGYTQQQQHDPGYDLAAGSDGDDNNDEKSYCIFKNNYFMWSRNSRKQRINYSVLSVAPSTGNKTPGFLCRPDHSGFLCSHCPWFKCGHHSLCLSFSNIISQEDAL